MHAIEILQEQLGKSLDFLHSKQLAALWRVVAALLKGQELWLTELGRNLPAACSIKHRIKAIDRFLGNQAIQATIPKIYAALAKLLLQATPRPLLLVDWTAAESGFYNLSAQIAFEGRALPILTRTYPKKKLANPRVEREFLNELRTIIPAHCRPVLVTDAGFLYKWTDSVRALGWDYVGRVRMKKIILSIFGCSMHLREVYKLAKRKPKDFGSIILGKNNPRSHRAVLSARPKTKGRYRLGRKGRPLTSAVARGSRDAAREPLLLITSLPEPARVVIDIYRMRMQIEETFRDQKSYRYGWASRLIRSSDPRRIDVLLLVGAIGTIAMHLLGLTIRGSTLARGLQANTERRRNVFSTFFLGKLVLHEKLESRLSPQALRATMENLIATLPSVERIAAMKPRAAP